MSVNVVKVLVVYHNDLDGKCCAAIARQALKERSIKPKLIPFSWNDKLDLPDLIDYQQIYILDCSLPKQEMLNLQSSFGKDNVIWIDHHITVIEAVGDVDIKGVRSELTPAACELTWKWFYTDKETPLAIKYISDRDTWTFKFNVTKDFCEWAMYEDMNPHNDKMWKMLFEQDELSLYSFIEAGNIIRTARLKSLKKTVRYNAFESKVGGVPCMAMNYSDYQATSDAGHIMLEMFDYDVAAIWAVTKNKDGDLIETWNLRGQNGANVGEIAKKFGGGGHKYASGFIRVIEKKK